ncbi:MAG: leucine-rich repeat domain-containing protein [Candidatus Faecousia sp.]|nr:leucine-rich repeat domain-containing protein [Candidatus Faecousia sp.]
MKSLLWKRTLCCLLSMILILGNLPVFSFAEESDGLCEHHTVHTSECGYSPAIPGSPCTHEHTQDCYQTVAECIHVHDDACGYNEEAGDSSCAHVCSEEYGCFRLVPDCRHAHDESCGYAEAVPEQPCAYACTECAEPGEDPSEPAEEPSEPKEDPSEPSEEPSEPKEEPSEPSEEPSEPEVDEAVEAVRALIEALPTLEEIKAMSTQEQAEVYTQVQKAYDAYDALTDDQKAQLPEAEEIFTSLFEYFNSLTAPTSDVLASGTCGDTLTWELTDDGVLTISGSGAMSDYDGSNAPWAECRDNIQSVVIESGVTKIGQFAFSVCSNLTDVTIPEGVTSIAVGAFMRCTGLKSISIPGTVTSIGDSAFYKCSSLTSLTIPEGVTRIGASAFRSCTSLADVTIADSVINIGDLAFANCTSLTGITLPSSLKTLGSNPFGGCTQITSLTISESNPSFCSVDGVLFNKACTNILAVPGGISGSYSIPDGVTGIASYAFWGCSDLTGVTIPDGVTSISSYAFRYCSSLTSIIIPNGVTSIGSYAFSDCSSLTSIIIPNGVTSIDPYVFSGCSSLTSIIIPSSVTRIYGYAFGDCGSLTSITFSGDAPTIYDPAFKNVTATVYYPADNSTWTGKTTNYGGNLTWKTYGTVASGTCGDNLTWKLTDYGVLTISGTGAMYDYPYRNAPWYANRSSIQKIVLDSHLTYIGERAFDGCSNLTDVTIPESVTGIGSFAFAFCHSLTGITLPSGLTTLGSNPFGYCNLLTSITIPETNASFCSVDGVLFNKACTEILSVPSGKSGSYSIPESVTGIDSNAFAGCKNLTDVIIPEGVTSIANAAFYYCSGLTGITIPEGVTSIGESVFEGCSGLTAITIPGSVTSIDRYAFSRCSSLTSITFSGDAPTINYSAFDDVTATVYYPNGNTTWENVAGKSYGGTLTWETYGPASEVASGTCGENLTWVLTSDGVLTINGTGDMYNYSSVSSTPWYSHASSITSLVVTEGVTSIGSYALRATSLKSVSFGNASLSLGNYSFAYCESLTSIDFGTGTIQPGEYVFAGCTALTSVHVPQNVVMNGSYSGIGSGLGMFTSCSSLQTATVDCGYVGPFFLESCYGMTQATFTNPNVQFYYLKNDSGHPFNAGSQTMNVNVVGHLCSQANVLVQKGQRSDITLTFSQIAGDTTQHTEKVLPGTATCTKAGLSEGKVCSVCGYVIEKQTNVKALGHALQSHDGKAATCLETGWEAYETCSRCNYTTYEEIPATGHTFSHVNSTPATCTEEGVREHYHCSVCDKNFEDENGTTELADTSIPAEGHRLTKVDGSAPTCTDKGVKEHFHCSVCGKDFADKNGTTEMTDTTIPTVEHEWGAWEVTTPATPEADGEETRKCASCQQEETRPLAYTGNRVELAGTGLENEQVVWIDGVAVPVQKDGSGDSYVTLPENSSSILVTYSFNTGSGDRHTQYPTGMKVYRVEKTDSGLTVEHLPELDNLLQYSGCSIRIVGVKGIRMITSISKSTRSALMGDGLAGYKLVEYGTAICRASALEGGAPMVLGTPGVKSNYAYKRGVADPIFKDTGSLIQYTNVLVGFTDEDCKEDIAMRPYIILEDEKGETVTLYGGIVYRSIGYIAYQNRNAFAPGSNAYNYVWDIIHYVYGDQYDADYKG